MKIKFILLFLLGGLSLSCQKGFDYDLKDVPPFEGLEVPAVGTGYQVHVPPFPVPANYEREIFVRMAVGNRQDIYVNKFEVLCRPGTHHLIAYGFHDERDPSNPAIGVMRDQNLADGRVNFNLNMGSGAMYCGAQEPNFTLQLPPGIAIRIPANASLDMNSHYFNVTNQTLFGEVFLNMTTIPVDSVKELLEIHPISNESVLLLPKNASTSIEYSETFWRRTEIRQMFAHMHKRGEVFSVYKVGGANDGELLYVSNDYQHPPYKFFDPPLVIEEGEGIKTYVQYNNETDREIRYGVTSEDEMGILFYSENGR
ncbi:MAG: hypothetical protein MRZ79_05885 [Bacteroidia bacterium]|nr:hypothetical protein [Bacteroidia bacterium]